MITAYSARGGDLLVLVRARCTVSGCRKALPLTLRLTRMGKALPVSHGSEVLDPRHSQAHVNSAHSPKTSLVPHSQQQQVAALASVVGEEGCES